MAIDFGTGNTTRYYTVPDHADFILPNGDWAWLALAYPQDATVIKNIVSTGGFGSANAFNLLAYNTANGDSLGVKVDALTEVFLNSAITVNAWQWMYATRRSGVLYGGTVPLSNPAGALEGTGPAISAAYDSATDVSIGRRDAISTRNWQGRCGPVAFISGAGITAAQAVELARGAPLLSMPFAPNIKFLWHGRTSANTTITDLIGGKVATKQGTSYGTEESDAQTPYVWFPEYTRGITVGGTTYNQAVAGSLTAAGALTKGTLRSIGGSSTPIGTIVKQTAKSYSGSITPSSILTSAILFTASIAGSITASGALNKLTMKALSGASTVSGAITKMTGKGLSASITVSGAIAKLTTKAFAGAITAAGALAQSYQVLKSLAGSITMTGSVAGLYIAFVAGVLKMLALMGVG